MGHCRICKDGDKRCSNPGTPSTRGIAQICIEGRWVEDYNVADRTDRTLDHNIVAAATLSTAVLVGGLILSVCIIACIVGGCFLKGKTEPKLFLPNAPTAAGSMQAGLEMGTIRPAMVSPMAQTAVARYGSQQAALQTATARYSNTVGGSPPGSARGLADQYSDAVARSGSYSPRTLASSAYDEAHQYSEDPRLLASHAHATAAQQPWMSTFK